jgi:hypothetical protein
MGSIVKAISVTTLVLSAGLVVTGATASASADARPRATVTVVDDSPVVVIGRGFARAERVTLRALVEGRRYSRVVRAGPTGRFKARFETVSAKCRALQVSAVGRTGRTAAFRRFEIPPPCGIVIQP